MSAEYEGKDPLEIAKQAERDLNSAAAKGGGKASDSGIDESAAQKFAGGEVTYGSAASGQGNKREIPQSEGGDVNPSTGKPYKAGDYEGIGGPDDKARIYAQEQGGNDDVQGNVRQGGETRRP